MKNKNKKEHKFAKKIANLFYSFGMKYEGRLILGKSISLATSSAFLMASAFLNVVVANIAIWLFLPIAISTILEVMYNYGAKKCDNIANKILEKCEIKDQFDAYTEISLDKIENQKKEVDKATINALSAELAADENLISQLSFDKAQQDRTKANQLLRNMINLCKTHTKSIKKGDLILSNEDGKFLTKDDKLQEMLDEYNFD